MSDVHVKSVEEILGGPAAFFDIQRTRLRDAGVDIAGCAISHLAFRTETYAEYLVVRDGLEKHAVANVENVWNGRPISKIVLAEPVKLAPGFDVRLIELIPPFHQCVYKMGLEHVGVVVGETVDEFGRRHRPMLTGQQFQSRYCEPYFVRFDDYTHVKFYRYGLKEVCEMEGREFDDFYHVENWTGV